MEFHIATHNSTAGKVYGNVKIHSENNPGRVITSGRNTSDKNLSVFVKDALFDVEDALPSQIKETHYMLVIFDNINNFN